MKKITLKIDGTEISAEPGQNILQVALDNGIDIPHFCYHESMGKDGNCRICLVEIEGNPKLVTSCTTPVQEGMNVLVNSEKARRARAGVLEFILVDHPLDCPVCDKAGECILQDYSYEHGYPHSRSKYDRKHFPVKDLGPDIYLWTERCIKCARCERFLDEVAGTGELGFFRRGSNTELDVFEGHPIDNPISINIVDICPVGALLDKDFLFEARVWDLKKVESICPGCSTGCNITYQSLDNILKRIRPRLNKDVNDHWICNEGRHSYKNVDKEDRLIEHTDKKGKKLPLETALEEIINTCEKIKDKDGADAILALGSPFLTNEENYLTGKIFGSELGAKIGMIPPRVVGKDQVFGDKFTIHAEKAPNTIGALKALGLGKYTEKDFSKHLKEIESGKIKAVIIFNGDTSLEFSKEQLKSLKKARSIFLCGSHPSTGLEKSADVLLAGNMTAEKEGTYTNFDGVTQRIRRAVFKPGNSEPEWKILLELASRWQLKIKANNPRAIFDLLAEENKDFKNVDYEKIGKKGFKH